MSEKEGRLIKTIELDKKLDEKLDQASCNVLDIFEELARKIAEEFGSSKNWRSFRMDELLQTYEK